MSVSQRMYDSIPLLRHYWRVLQYMSLLCHLKNNRKLSESLSKKRKKEKKTLRESMHISQRVLSNLQCTTATKPTGQETETSYHILLIEKQHKPEPTSAGTRH